MLLQQFHAYLDHISRYPSLKSLSYQHSIGFVLGIFFVIQTASGLLLSMHYTGTAEGAFASIELMIRDITGSDILRYLHANVASICFGLLYLHMFKAVLLKAANWPRTMVWSIGAVIYILAIGAAFLGYVLVWGQMSYWAVIVITNLITVIPGGDVLLGWIWGGPCVSGDTLQRFYSLHFLLPFVVLALAGLHLLMLHNVKNAPRLGSAATFDQVAFGTYFLVKDWMVLTMVAALMVYLVGWVPDMLGHPDNYVEADACVTPAHIVPEWYLLYWYGVLRAIPNKTMGVVAMAGGLIGLVTMGWLGITARGWIGSLRGRWADPTIRGTADNVSRSLAWFGIISFGLNAWLAGQVPLYPWTHLGLVCGIMSMMG